MIGYNVATKIDVTNIDNTVQFVPQGSKPQVKFEGVTYTLEKIHSHWASTIFQGSEHIVDSKQYTGELHFIHWNTKYSSFSDAVDKSDGLLVWSHFLMADSYNTNTNSNLGWVWAAMAWVKNTATRSTYATSAYSLESLLPTKDPAFYQLYTYKGSLTTPPCHESVKWVVNKVPISISETQMNYFKNVRDAKMTVGNQVSYAGNNFRRPQSLNDRNVYANFHMHDLTPQLDCWNGKF
jgi:carbonic anhydrase